MEDRRRPKWKKFTGPSRGRPPRGSWQPAIPSWEKQFCRVIGSIEWETLLQKKKFIHLYANVVNWNDSAGKEAFFNAKERFLAEINGLSCDTSLPDPNLYIDEITWDTEPNLDEFEFKSMPSGADEHHEPVIIFGDSLLPSIGYSGWSDQEDEKLKAPSGSNPAADPRHQTPVDHLNKNHEQVPVSSDCRVAFDGETQRRQRYGNKFKAPSGSNPAADPRHQTPVDHLNKNHEQVPVSSDCRVAFDGETQRRQRYGNKFPRRNHHRGAAYWGQHHSTDKRADQRV